MLVAAILLVGVLGIFSSVSAVFNSQHVRMLNQDDARTAINQIARYVRMASSSADNLTTQSNAVATADPQNIEFYCDVDGDNLAEKVRYYLAGSTLMMQTAEPVWVTGTNPHYSYPAYNTNGVIVQDAIRNGSAPVFRYYYYINPGVLAEFTPTTASARQLVVTVSVSLVVNARPELAKGSVALATDVQIRQRYEGGLSQ
jgi:hypothetical protein